MDIRIQGRVDVVSHHAVAVGVVVGWNLHGSKGTCLGRAYSASGLKKPRSVSILCTGTHRLGDVLHPFGEGGLQSIWDNAVRIADPLASLKETYKDSASTYALCRWCLAYICLSKGSNSDI